MDARLRAAMQFKVEKAVRIEPGRFPNVEIGQGTIIAPPVGAAWAIFGALGGGGAGDVWQAFDLVELFEMRYPLVRLTLPPVPPEGAIWRCDTATTAALPLLAESERHVAFKVLRLGQLAVQHHEEMIKRFLLEADICGTTREPQIPVRVVVRLRPLPCFAMELIDGETLEAYLERVRAERGYIPWFIITKVLGDVLDILEVLHARGIVHRDLKPSNLMMARSAGWRREILRILDFGIAKMLSEHELAATVGPQGTQQVLGGRRGRRAEAMSRIGGLHMLTPIASAPEQHAPPGQQHITFATDYYLVGLMLYEMVTGELWLPLSEDLQVIRRGMVRQMPAISHPDLGARTNAVLRNFLTWLLAYHPRERPQTLREVLDGARERPGFRAVREQHRKEGGPPPVPPDA